MFSDVLPPTEADPGGGGGGGGGAMGAVAPPLSDK